MINRNRLLKTGFALASVAYGFLLSNGARASERESAAHCFLQPEAVGAYRWQDGIANLSSGLGWTPLNVICPISIDDVQFKQNEIDSVYVSYIDGNNQFGAAHNFHVNACVSSFNGASATVCFGDRELNPGTATGGFWTQIPGDMSNFLRSTGSFPYANLVVTIPANNGWPSVLRGIEIFR